MGMARFHPVQGVWPIFKKVLQQERQDWLSGVITTLAIPLTFFLAFGLGLRSYIADIDGVPYMVFVAPGLISFTVLYEAYRTGGWGIWLDRWHQRMLSEYLIKPITPLDIILGEILGGFVVAILKGMIVAGVLLLLAPIQLQPMHLLLYLVHLFPGCIVFTCTGVLVGAFFRKPDQIAHIQTVVITPLLYLGGMFFPIHEFPQALIPVVRLLPTTALFEGGRQALLNGGIHGFSLAVLWFSAALFLFIAPRLFRRIVTE